MIRKGIILSGGKGTRLYPASLAVSKQLLPIYNKPMIYYPLSTLMGIGINEILIITTPEENDRYKSLLGNGLQWGMNLHYLVQEEPKGIAQSFILAEDYIKNSPTALILGDNLFYGYQLSTRLKNASDNTKSAGIFAYAVNNPEQYGIVNFDKNKKIDMIVEKPSQPQSNFAITGLYFYDKNVVNLAKQLKPSPRGELEITDLNNAYLKLKKLEIHFLNEGDTWLDAGSVDTLLEASQFIKAIENRQGVKISSPDEIAWKNKWINDKQLMEIAKALKANDYGNYLMKILKKKRG